MSIVDEWIKAKNAEQEAIARRRHIEERMIAELKIDPEKEANQTIKHDLGALRISVRMNRRINGDKLQEIAKNAGISNQLSTLFRWKPEINAKEWKTAPDAIKSILSPAIVTQPGRPSFSFTNKDFDK